MTDADADADAEALDLAVARTGHERWRSLVEEQPEAWANVRAIAAGVPLPAAAPAAPCPDLASLKARAALCPHRTPAGGCACSGYCSLGRGFPHPTSGREIASLDDCAACPELPALAIPLPH